MEEKFNVGAETDSEPDGLRLRGTNPYSAAHKLCDHRQATQPLGISVSYVNYDQQKRGAGNK